MRGACVQQAKILLVDDEKGITDYLAPMLARAGFTLSVAHDGEAALEQIGYQKPDLVVLDVIMPKVDGREVCRRLRQADNWIPVIMLTQLDTPTDRVLSLEEGADDYLCKPFDPQELIARVRAVLRRRASATQRKPLSMSGKLQSSQLILDRRSRRVERNGEQLDLTPKAVALLEFLMLHPDQVFSRERLMDSVWGWAQAVASRAVDMRIAELRRALGDDADHPIYLETVIGVGYRFLPPVTGGD
jgi:DNA-binding response OmpR family regulator